MRNVLVTGGSRGIGKSIVSELTAAGYKVSYTYNNTLPLKEYSNGSQGYKLDVNDSSACLALLEKLEETNSFPEVLINNAGITKDVLFSKMTAEQWIEVLNTNLLSLFNLTNPIFARMKKNGFGRIVNISSVNASKGQVGQVNYCTAKAGVLGFTRSLALEGAKYGITVNTMSPGYIATDMVMAIQEDVRDRVVNSIPVGRFGFPEEIAKSIKFLLSDDASYITGANIEVNGGLNFG